MGTSVFGVRIRLRDLPDPATQNTDIGLYNVTSALASDASAGQPNVVLVSSAGFETGCRVLVKDDDNQYTYYIKSISGNTLTLTENLKVACNVSTKNGATWQDSEFRWVQNTVSGTTITWKTGMIIDKGISEYTRSIPLDKGGDIAENGSCGVTVKNTDSLFQTLRDADIYLNGLDFDVFNFADAVASVCWAGVCEKPTWDSTSYHIPATGKLNKRIAQILTPITEQNFPDATSDILGQFVPATFGENRRQKFIRTSNAEEVQASDQSYPSVYASPRGIKSFPVLSATGTPAKVYELALGISKIGSGSIMPTINNMWLRVTEGGSIDETFTGQARKIVTYAETTVGGYPAVQVTLGEIFEKNLSGNTSASAVNQAWAEIVDARSQFTTDIWPCKAYLDNEDMTSEISSGYDLFVHSDKSRVSVVTVGKSVPVTEDNPSYVRIPQSGYSSSTSNQDKNELEINLSQFSGSLSRINGFIILPVSNFQKMSDPSTLNNTNWGSVGDPFNNPLYYKSDGVYSTTTDSPSISQVGGDENVTDRDYGSTAVYTLSGWSSSNALCFDFDLPEVDFDFDSVYIGVRLQNAGAVTGVRLKHKKFLGRASDIISASSTGLDNYTVDDIMDEYYQSNTPSTQNQNFYYSQNTSPDAINWYLTGYSRFLFDGITPDTYKNIHKCALFVVSAGNCTVTINELCVIFKLVGSTDKAIYTPHRGRIYNSRWDNRVPTGNLMEDPRHIMEHVCRLQNWSERSVTPSIGWGLTYPGVSLIATGSTVTGSFDALDAEFISLGSLKAARQIEDENEGYTDDIKRTLCRNFHMANWVNKAGQECVLRMIRSEYSPGDLITLAHITDRKKIKITEPSPENVYCEPFVRYDIDPATGNPQRIIRVKNASAYTFSDGWIEAPDGVFSGSGEQSEYWGRCHALWQKTNMVTKPPTELTDIKWANGNVTNADAIAKEYLTNWITWMHNIKVSFPIHTERAKFLEECHRFKLQLPHQTGNTQVECLLTKVTVDPNHPFESTVEAIIYAETLPVGFDIQDTMTMLTGNDNWQDTLTAGANDTQDVL